MRFYLYVMFLGLLLWPAGAFASRGFHPAGNDAEQTLDALLKLGKDAALAQYLLRGETPNTALDAQLSEMVTPKLMQGWRETEADTVYSRCGGQYLEGQVCGVRENPLTCLDFLTDVFMYRTDSAEAFGDAQRQTLIAMQLPGGQNVIANYLLIKIGNRWKIDGIDCMGSGPDFNF